MMTFDDSQPMVLTHGDLSLHNIIMGNDGKMWLVDWEFSGFYLPWFEYIATMSAAENDNERYTAVACWWRHIPWVTGAWMKEKSIITHERHTLTWIKRLTS
jgi:thiamine kinase-like enzyme